MSGAVLFWTLFLIVLGVFAFIYMIKSFRARRGMDGFLELMLFLFVLIFLGGVLIGGSTAAD
jgi:hypothetical protein